jgi:hypothetical protein
MLPPLEPPDTLVRPRPVRGAQSVTCCGLTTVPNLKQVCRMLSALHLNQCSAAAMWIDTILLPGGSAEAMKSFSAQTLRRPNSIRSYRSFPCVAPTSTVFERAQRAASRRGRPYDGLTETSAAAFARVYEFWFSPGVRYADPPATPAAFSNRFRLFRKSARFAGYGTLALRPSQTIRLNLSASPR